MVGEKYDTSWPETTTPDIETQLRALEKKEANIEFIQKGQASYYHDSLEGQKTASETLFSNSKLIAAAHGRKLGTMVEVTNLDNKKTVRVRIEDTGPRKTKDKDGNKLKKPIPHPTRVIDLSQAAFKQLSSDGLRPGILKNVQVKAIS